MIWIHGTLHLPGSSDSCASVSRVARTRGTHHGVQHIFVFLVEIGQAGLGLLASSDLPTLASQSVGITDVSHGAWLITIIS